MMIHHLPPPLSIAAVFLVFASPGASVLERQALVELYESTDGGNWKNSSGWLTGDPCENDWFGVTCTSCNNCTEGARVLSLDLYDNSLRGTIPTEIGNLAFLEGIDLYSNRLTGTIPTEIGYLTSLERLDADDNDLTGTIPTEIGNMDSLEVLYLHSNVLTGTIPTEIGNVDTLELFYADYNLQLNGTIPTEIGNLKALQALRLYWTGLNGTIPTEIGYLTDLVDLRLQRNQLTGSIPTEIANLKDLVYFYVDYNYLNGNLPTAIFDRSIAEGLLLRAEPQYSLPNPDAGLLSAWEWVGVAAGVGVSLPFLIASILACTS